MKLFIYSIKQLRSIATLPRATAILLICIFCLSCGSVKNLNGSLMSKGSQQDHFLNESQCQSSFSLSNYLKSNESCYQIQKNEFDTVYSLENQRMLTPWIPCNSVQLVSMASNKQFPFDKAISWVAEKSRFSIDHIESALQQPEVALALGGTRDHPAFESPNHRALVSIIRNAKHTIFLNTLIFGGVWATEIIREIMLRKKEAGIEIVILRDNENVFAFSAETNPLWQRLLEHGKKTKNLTVMRSNFEFRTQSAIPFGFDRVTKLLAPFAKEGVSVSGKSDHTKILIADGFTDSATMFVSSKNITDNNLLNFDESAIVKGPAAAAAQASFIGDIRLGEKLALTESLQKNIKLISDEDRKMLEGWYALDQKLRDPSKDGLKFTPQGNSSVRLSENNADGTVRNTEMSVLQLIAGAKKNVRMYYFLSYNPMLARAIADATLKLGAQNVKILSDATSTFAMNITLNSMIRDELKHAKMEPLTDQILKWRLTAPLISFPKDAGRINIRQQQHTKTIIVDDEVVYLGSTNFDVATLSGPFREFSVSLKDSQLAQEASTIFDSIWQDPQQAVSTKEIIEIRRGSGEAPPSQIVQNSIINILKTEQARIGSLNPRNFVDTEKCN